MNQRIAIGSAARIARLALVFGFCARVAAPQVNPVNYTFLVGSGFLCDGNDGSTCPATAKAVRGDSYEVSGAGTFDLQNKSVKAAGTFNHKSTNGSLLETGVWIASELVSFVSYGTAPGAMLHEKSGLNPRQFAPMRLKFSFGPMPTGGLAVFRIRLLIFSGATKTGVLQVNCALADVPRERSVEGIRLSFENDGNEFSEEAGGRVMFLSTRPEANSIGRAPDNREVWDSVKRKDN